MSASATSVTVGILKSMTIDRRIDFPSFLARRRETLSDWLTRTRVSSYEQFVVQLEKMDARPVARDVYEAAAAPKLTATEQADSDEINDALRRSIRARKLIVEDDGASTVVETQAESVTQDEPAAVDISAEMVTDQPTRGKRRNRRQTEGEATDSTAESAD